MASHLTQGIFDRALELHKSGNFQEAIELYQSFLQEAPRDFNALRLLGLAHAHKTEYAQAEGFLRQAIAVQAGLPQINFDLAQVLIALKRPAEAFAQIRLCRQQLPDGHALYPSIIDLLYQANNYRDTVDACTAYLATGAAEPRIREILASVLVGMRRFDEAVAIFDALTAEGKISFGGSYNFSLALSNVGRFADVVERSVSILKQWPDHKPTQTNLISALHYCDRFDNALSALVHIEDTGTTPDPSINNRDAILDRLDKIVGRLPGEDKSLVYVMSSLWHIGHLAGDLLYLSSTYPDHKIAVIVSNEAFGKICNEEVYRIISGRVRFAGTDDRSILACREASLGIFERGGRTYYLMPNQSTISGYYRHLSQGGKARYFDLLDDQKERGEALRKSLGIPEDAPIVVLHVRQEGWHAFSPPIRNAEIATYLPTIRFLTSQGYYVVRIGDKSMTPLPRDLGPQVIDAPFCEAYTPLFDPYFITSAQFMMTTNSGPSEFARATGRPLLLTNGLPFYSLVPGSFEMVAFKHYFQETGGVERPLRLQEILDLGLADGWNERLFNATGIRVAPMTAVEIEAACRDMIDSQKHLTWDPTHSIAQYDRPNAAQAEFRRICAAENDRRKVDPTHTRLGSDWFGYAIPCVDISPSYCETNPL